MVASKWCGSGRLVSVVTIGSASVYIPDKFFGSLLMAVARMVEVISTTNNVRRAPRINLDRLYITHTRSIITTAATIRVCFYESELHNNSQSAAPKARVSVQLVVVVII